MPLYYSTWLEPPLQLTKQWAGCMHAITIPHMSTRTVSVLQIRIVTLSFTENYNQKVKKVINIGAVELACFCLRFFKCLLIIIKDLTYSFTVFKEQILLYVFRHTRT